MPTRIKPDVNEISLAFNPANLKKFLMHKDDDKNKILKEGGVTTMKKAVEVLNKEDKLFKEADFLTFLKDAKLSDESSEYILGAFKLLTMSKTDLPEGFVVDLLKAIPEVADILLVQKADEPDLEKIKVDLRKELEGEIRTKLEKELKMNKDEKVVALIAQVGDLTKELGVTKKDLEKEQDARRLSEITAEIKDMNIPGDLEKMAKTLLIAEKSNPEIAKDISEMLTATGTALQEAGIFGEVGSSGDGKSTDESLQKLVEIRDNFMKADSKMPSHVAFAKACRENPDLYRDYTKDHLRKGGNH